MTGLYEGVLTGKGLTWGGSLVRTQATGYGLIYILDAMLKDHSMELAGKTVVVSGSGNVAIYAVEKAQQLGAKVVAMSDSNGYIYDAEGIRLDVVKEIKEVRRGRIKEYAAAVPGSVYTEGKGIWSVKCDIALPCATQNELKDVYKRQAYCGCSGISDLHSVYRGVFEGVTGGQFGNEQVAKRIVNIRFDQCCAWKSSLCMVFFIKQRFLIRQRCGILKEGSAGPMLSLIHIFL